MTLSRLGHCQQVRLGLAQNAFTVGVIASQALLRATGITSRAGDGASYFIPLKARYIQAGGQATAGPANATATIDGSYY